MLTLDLIHSIVIKCALSSLLTEVIPFLLKYFPERKTAPVISPQLLIIKMNSSPRVLMTGVMAAALVPIVSAFL